MHIAIIGIGAMGCLFAARLNELVHLTMIGHWPAQLTALQQTGLTIEESNGRLHTIPIQATNTPQNLPPCHLALILVKSHQTAQAATIAKQVLHPTGVAITLQNGLGNLETIASTIGATRVTVGITTQGATIVAPGHVKHAGHGPTHLALTATTNTTLQQFATHLQAAGLETHLTDNVDSLIWGKLAINAGINPLTALLQVPNGYLATDDTARQLMIAAAEETALVAQAHHISLPYPHPGQQTVTVAQNTALNHSSMLQDVWRGAPTEIDAICGAVVRYGRIANLPTPVNQTLQHLVHHINPTQPLSVSQIKEMIAKEAT